MAVGASNSSRECVHLYTAQIPEAAQPSIIEEIESLNERLCLKLLRVRVAIKMPNIFPQLPHEHIQGSTPLQLPKYIYMHMYIPHSFTHTLGTHVNSLHTYTYTQTYIHYLYSHSPRDIYKHYLHTYTECINYNRRNIIHKNWKSCFYKKYGLNPKIGIVSPGGQCLITFKCEI